MTSRTLLLCCLACAPAHAQVAPGAPVGSPADRDLPRDPATPSAAAIRASERPGSVIDDSGVNIRSGDFTWTFWGYGERVFNPGRGAPDFWRRFRQGSEFDLPRISDSLRPAIVYEVDLTDTNFLAGGVGGRNGLGRRDFENVFLAIQDAADATQLRGLVGENTAILSREDNLSSGNLPTVNRSLVLEEHNGAGIFGSQFGVQFGMALSPGSSIAVAAMDNRGSFNRDVPRYGVGNSLAAKFAATPLKDADHGRQFAWGAGVDFTGGFGGQTFPLLTAILQDQVGGTPVRGDKVSEEVDVAFTFPALFAQPATLEAEAILSRFSGSRTDVVGGYAMLQHRVFTADALGDLDLFARYDAVSITTGGVSGRMLQQSFRLGTNFNLPRSRHRLNLHLEYAHNSADGPPVLVQRHASDEAVVELRFSLQPYIRH